MRGAIPEVVGQYTDAETGFQYLRARYYDPATGQFLTRDPIEAATRSAYGYVGGNPINTTDPSGLFCLFSNGDGCLDIPEILGIGGKGVVQGAKDVERTVGAVLDSPGGGHDFGTFGAGIFNLGYGAFKITRGVAVLAATPAIASIPFIGPVAGPAAAAYGAYQLGTGSARVVRGIRQVGTGPESDDCITIGNNINRFLRGIVPGERGIDFVGGLL